MQTEQNTDKLILPPTNLTEALQYIEDGWKARENLDFEGADAKLKAALAFFEEAEEYGHMVEALNHLAYSMNMQGKIDIRKGADYANRALEVATENNIKPVLALRANMTLASSLGDFERASFFACQLAQRQPDSLDKADTISHQALFEMRTGNIKMAEKFMEVSLKMFDDMWKTKKDEDGPHKFIWKTRALGTHALITYNQGDTDKALQILYEALSMAKERNLKTRTVEIEYLIENIKKR